MKKTVYHDMASFSKIIRKTVPVKKKVNVAKKEVVVKKDMNDEDIIQEIMEMTESKSLENNIALGLVGDMESKCYFVEVIKGKIERKIEVINKDKNMTGCLLSLILSLIKNDNKHPEIDKCKKVIVTRSQIVVL
jgi:CRISPR/Cas system CSM-associated protein Csm4 (group 5 of RAMP superfamily)